MDIEITIKNYRCFPREKPAKLNLRKGFTNCTNYKREYIVVKFPDGSPVENKVITYVVKNRQNGLKTSFNYVRHILMGLFEHSMPDDYIQYAKSRVFQNNPDLNEEVGNFCESYRQNLGK